MNPKVTVHALWDILAGWTEAVKEIENLYNFNKDVFGFMVCLVLLPRVPMVFTFWTCSTLSLSTSLEEDIWELGVFFFSLSHRFFGQDPLSLIGAFMFLWRILLFERFRYISLLWFISWLMLVYHFSLTIGRAGKNRAWWGRRGAYWQVTGWVLVTSPSSCLGKMTLISSKARHTLFFSVREWSLFFSFFF